MDMTKQAASTVQSLDELVGRQADIAASAYLYRADRPTEENPPESWLALLWYAGQPLNQPVDRSAPAIAQALCALLWEEIRPLWQVELYWDAGAAHRPAPHELCLTTLDNQGPASSWWNNLAAVPKTVTPIVSGDGLTYVYTLDTPTCGIIISTGNGRPAADYDVPRVRTLVADVWKKMEVEIEWGFDEGGSARDYSGRLETYDGMIAGLRTLDGNDGTKVLDAHTWSSSGIVSARRGIQFSLLYMGTSQWRETQPFTSQEEDVARTILTLWTQAGNLSFLAADFEHGPVLAPEYGFFVRRTSPLPPATADSAATKALASPAASAREFIAELAARQATTLRERTRVHEEASWEGAVTQRHGDELPPFPTSPPGTEPRMQVMLPSARLMAQWNLSYWHLLRHCERHPVTNRLWFNDFPYGILAAETYMILAALDVMGAHQAAEDGYEQWVSLPLQPRVEAGQGQSGYDQPDKQHGGSMPDRPVGLFSEGLGSLTLAEGVPGAGGHMDGIHAYGPGNIGWALIEHFRITGDRAWWQASAPRITANVEWMLRQRQLLARVLPAGERLWCKGLQPPLQPTPDSGGLFLQYYWAEGYYWSSVSHLAAALNEVDPGSGASLTAEAEAYRRDLLAAVERSIALSPVVPVRDGTYHSVIPFACYVRGLGTGAWGWLRDGSSGHWGPLTFETDLAAAPLLYPAKLLPLDDVRVQGYLDVLEDRLLVDNPRTGAAPWFFGGWQHQVGIQKTFEVHLAADDIPVYLRSLFNSYAAHILPQDGYTFNEHAFAGPPDKIFEDAAFLYRVRNLLVMEEEQQLWLARATPRAWLQHGETIAVKNAPSYFGTLDYKIISDVDHGAIRATVKMPERKQAGEVLLRLRHPLAAPMQSVTVNGQDWMDFDVEKEFIRLPHCNGLVSVEAKY